MKAIFRFFLATLVLFGLAFAHAQQEPDPLKFIDQPLQEEIVLPDWFKVSFLDLKEDLEEALQDNKQGLIVYYGQKLCPYCKAHLQNNWGEKDILAYTLENFDVIAINVRGQKPVVDFDGSEYTEKLFSVKQQTNFTPSISFYTGDGLVLKLRGYRPPYQFRAALEYVADQHYKTEPFSNYMARAESAYSYGKETLNDNPQFERGPYILDRSHVAAKQPLLVSFERPRCHACDVLHAEPLQNPQIKQRLAKLSVSQIDMTSDAPVLTPDGNKMTARQWSQSLGLDYAPTLVFFNQQGQEIIRIGSVVWFYRLRNVLDFVTSKGYIEQPNFQLWQQQSTR
ncbi:MAG: thioredoxin fold domain-containing protein [Thioalkalispiraceae bacterium]|jgi:thioredoxin-related protein